MAAAQGDVIPGPLREVLRRPDLDAPVQRQRLWLEARVLGVYVVDGRPSAAIAASGSAPIHSKWLGSKLTPTVSPTASRSRKKVPTL